MSDDSATLGRFFDGPPMTGEQRGAVESTGGIASLRARVARRVPEAAWPAVFAEVVKAANEFLDGGIPSIIESAWTTAHALPGITDAAKHAPHELVVVPLVTHSINSIQQPYVDVLVANTPLGRVSFEINIALTLAGAILTLRDGKIVELRVGSCQGSGSMSCEGIVIAKRTLSPVKLPAVMSFNGGASPPPRADAHALSEGAGTNGAPGTAPE